MTTHSSIKLSLYIWFLVCRFDGVGFLKRWGGKKIMFVGDSLSLNMWESLSCMIHASVPNTKTSFVRKDSLSSATFQVSSSIPAFFFSSIFFQNQLSRLRNILLYSIKKKTMKIHEKKAPENGGNHASL